MFQELKTTKVETGSNADVMSLDSANIFGELWGVILYRGSEDATVKIYDADSADGDEILALQGTTECPSPSVLLSNPIPMTAGCFTVLTGTGAFALVLTAK